MVVDIHKVITSNPITKGIMSPWGSNSKANSIRGKLFNKYTGPGNNLSKQVKFDPQTGKIIQIYDQPSSSNDRCSMYHDIAYTIAQNTGVNNRDIKNKKLQADEKWLQCFKPRSPWDIAAYTAIKSKKTLGLGVENHNKILSEELHKTKRKNYTRRRIIVNHIDEIFAADLVEMQKFAKLNRGYRYLITCIDIFSKFAWVIPLKDKKGITIKNALQKIFNKRKPKFLWTDKGKEFYNKQVQDLLNENNIKLYSTNNSEIKSAVVERFNRTFKNMMYKKFTENNNTIFYNILDELVNNYNNKYHSTIKMTPIEGSKKINEKKLKNIYNFEKTKKLGKFKIGDRVRISLEKNIFEKGYETNWTQEIFVIYDIKYSNVPYYYLKDLNNEKLQGTFYEQELQKTKQDDLYTIEKILKTDKDKIYVKWRGYDNSFNSWINKNMVTKYL